MTASPSPTPSPRLSPSPTGNDRPPRLAGAVFRVSSGNLLEMYDFMIFGYYAGPIGHAFFPARSPLASLLLAFATFGAGFLMRPLGAIVLGGLVDRIGLRRGLLLTLGLMAIGTAVLALTPTYAAIGLAAPALVLAGRLVQGFSAGVELGSTSVFLAAIAPPGRRGFVVSFQSASQQVAVIAAALLALAIGHALGPARTDAWGWRIPIALGCLLAPLLLWLRRSLADPVAPGGHPTAAAAAAALWEHRAIVARGAALVLMTTVSFYLVTAYTPSFGRAVLHLSAGASLAVTLAVGAINLALLPLAGALSDRVGRRPILLATASLAIVVAYPAMRWLAADPSFGRLLAVEGVLAAMYATWNGALIVHLVELVPPALRTGGFSLSYSLATCVGGFTPFACTALIGATGDRAMPGAWMTAAAVCGLLAALTGGRAPPANGAVASRAA